MESTEIPPISEIWSSAYADTEPDFITALQPPLPFQEAVLDPYVYHWDSNIYPVQGNTQIIHRMKICHLGQKYQIFFEFNCFLFLC